MKDLRERLAKAGVHTLLVQFADLNGTAKGKLVPLGQLDHVLSTGAGFSGPSIVGTGLPRTGPRSEYYARGYASTAVPLPWMPGVARIVGDGFVDGEPFEACPRQVLKRQLARLAERGWQLQLGIEPEFFLLDPAADAPRAADAEDRLDKPSYDLQSLLRQREALLALQQGLQACGLAVLQIDHEDAHGQYEINFQHEHALASCDHLLLFKLAAHEIARRHGQRFSMMPKPFADQPGSGMHFHVSLWKGLGEDARCLFTPRRADGSADRSTELSPLGRQFMAGVLAHSTGLAALAAPTVNSYKRLVVGESRSGTSWAPAVIAHGPNNRTALVRTLHGRFEWRLPDASANPYLAAAGLVAAGLDGLERQLDPGPACTDDLFAGTPAQLRSRGIGILPQSLNQACDALEADAVLGAALGEALLREFLALKRDEATAYARHVSDWEFRRYADLF